MSEIFTKFFLKVFMSIILLTMPATYNIYDPAADFVGIDSTNLSFGRRKNSLLRATPVTNAATSAPNKPYKTKAEKNAAKRKRRKEAKAAKRNSSAPNSAPNSSAPNRGRKSVADIVKLPFQNSDQARNNHAFGKMLKHMRGLCLNDETMKKRFDVHPPMILPKGHNEYERYVAEVTKASTALCTALTKNYDGVKKIVLFPMGHSSKMGKKKVQRTVTMQMFDMTVFRIVLIKIYSKINPENRNFQAESLNKKADDFGEPIVDYMKALNTYVNARKQIYNNFSNALQNKHNENVPNLSLGSEFLDWSSIDIGSHVYSNTYDVDIDMD